MNPLSALLSRCVALVLSHLPASAERCRAAALLVRNGHIIALDPDHKVAPAMAVRDDKVLAVGDVKTLATWASHHRGHDEITPSPSPQIDSRPTYAHCFVQV